MQLPSHIFDLANHLNLELKEEDRAVCEFASQVFIKCRELALDEYDYMTDRFKECVYLENPLLFVMIAIALSDIEFLLAHCRNYYNIARVLQGVKVQCRICLYAGYNSHVLYHKKSCLKQDKRLFLTINPVTNVTYLCLFGCEAKAWKRPREIYEHMYHSHS